MATLSERFAERLEDLRAVAPSVELVLLFGSVIGGRSRADSDTDIAVRCDGPADLDALYLLLAPRLATSRLDLVDLRRTGSLLAFQVARHGRLLYERDPGASGAFSRWPHAATAIPTSSAGRNAGRSTPSSSARASNEPGRRRPRSPQAGPDRRLAGRAGPLAQLTLSEYRRVSTSGRQPSD